MNRENVWKKYTKCGLYSAIPNEHYGRMDSKKIFISMGIVVKQVYIYLCNNRICFQEIVRENRSAKDTLDKMRFSTFMLHSFFFLLF